MFLSMEYFLAGWDLDNIPKIIKEIIHTHWVLAIRIWLLPKNND